MLTSHLLLLLHLLSGGNIVANVMIKILESSTPVPKPVGLIFAYGALDFNFSSWMSPASLRILRSEQSSSHIPGLEDGKDHLVSLFHACVPLF